MRGLSSQGTTCFCDRVEMNSDDVILLYTMRSPPGSVGMKSDDVIARDAVKLTGGLSTISLERDSHG